MTQIERIAYYESLMDQASAVLNLIEHTAPFIRDLDSYYTSPQWKEDYAADEAGKLPADLKRGVLSEDGVYNLLERWREIVALPENTTDDHSDSSVFIPTIDLEKSIRVLHERERGIATYVDLMSMAGKVDLNNPDFRRRFNGFYRIRRSEEWQDVYYGLMAEYREKAEYSNRANVCFGEILLRLQQGTGQIETSFASKMLATLDHDKPIWDSNVLRALKLRLSGTTMEIRFSNAVVVYDQICQWYAGFLKTETARQWLERFDLEFPEYGCISDTKKIDFILWAAEA